MLSKSNYFLVLLVAQLIGMIFYCGHPSRFDILVFVRSEWYVLQFFRIFYVYHDHYLLIGGGLLTPLFYGDPPPLYCLPPHFKILSNHPFSVASNSTLTAPFVVLFLWLNGWSRHIWCSVLYNDNMDLNMSSFGTFVLGTYATSLKFT